jgi:hypothetical protein
VSGPVRPVDGVPHVILGTQRLARVTVVDERGGAGGVLLWPNTWSRRWSAWRRWPG